MHVTTHMRVEEVSVHVTTHEGGGRYQCMSLHMRVEGGISAWRVEGGISACHYT